MAIHVVATMYPKVEIRDELIGHLQELAEQVQLHELGTLVDYFFYDAKINEIIAIEKYEDQEALQAHGTTEHMKAFASKVPDLIEKAPVVRSGSFVGGHETRSLFSI